MKPHTLCYIVVPATATPPERSVNGLPVTTLSRFIASDGVPFWRVAPDLHVVLDQCYRCRTGQILKPGPLSFNHIREDWLRPIGGLDAPESTDTPTFTDANALA